MQTIETTGDGMKMARKTFKFRLYPNRLQRERLVATLDGCRELYNAGLQERIGAWKNRTPVRVYDQTNQLPDIKKARPDVATIYSQVLQDSLHRLDKTFKAFFNRAKRGQKAGFPRFKGRNRYNSFTYPQNGFELGSKLQLSKIGNIKIKQHRDIVGRIKTLTLRREAGCWYACFSCEAEPQPLPKSDAAVGIDVGLESFAVLSNGTTIDNPRWYRAAQAKLRVAQRRVARRKKGSRRRKAVQIFQRIHGHITNQRKDFQHKLSHSLVQRYGTIAVEDLNVKGLAGGWLAKSVHDAGWSGFLNMLAYKAENAGRKLIAVDPRNTSQTCICGHRVPKRLSDREHACTACGLVASRDYVSAQVILQRAGIPPSNANVGDVIPCVV